MPVSHTTHEQVALEDPERHWELDCGYLRRKPGMTAEHYYPVRRLAWSLNRQLDIDEFAVATDNTRLRVSSGRYYVPDLCVIPTALVRAKLTRSGRLEVFDEPMPLVIEAWSPSTGDYDVDTKFPEYQRRGGGEIWRLQPYERTLTAWERQPDGTYTETRLTGGIVRPTWLPGVTIDLDTLFDRPRAASRPTPA
jgi:Uma2 family endonuclease